jgi:hypothetical protein
VKKLFSLLFLLAFVLTVSAQQSTLRPIVKNVQQGQYVDFGGVNLVAVDSLLVADTAQYIIPVTHTNDVNPFLSTYWNKIGAGTATVTVNFYQANDPAPENFVTIKKGKALGAYIKTLTYSASGWNQISFAQDSAAFEGRYLKVEFITSSTSTVKGKLFNRIKFNIK